MQTKKEITVQNRTWYGLNATVIIGPALMHWTGWRGLRIPHPGVINWLLRKGLTDNARDTLSVKHEIGHLETMPLAVLYMAMNLSVIFAAGQTDLRNIILALISTQAAWEVMSELFTITSSAQLYRKIYEGVTRIYRTVFWIFSGILVLMDWVIIML
jgi:hypothetical protein